MSSSPDSARARMHLHGLAERDDDAPPAARCAARSGLATSPPTTRGWALRRAGAPSGRSHSDERYPRGCSAGSSTVTSARAFLAPHVGRHLPAADESPSSAEARGGQCHEHRHAPPSCAPSNARCEDRSDRPCRQGIERSHCALRPTADVLAPPNDRARRRREARREPPAPCFLYRRHAQSRPLGSTRRYRGHTPQTRVDRRHTSARGSPSCVSVPVRLRVCASHDRIARCVSAVASCAGIASHPTPRKSRRDRRSPR